MADDIRLVFVDSIAASASKDPSTGGTLELLRRSWSDQVLSNACEMVDKQAWHLDNGISTPGTDQDIEFELLQVLGQYPKY